MTPRAPARLDDLDPAEVVDEYERRGLAALDDATLIEAAAEIVARPKTPPADSFVLHAPLELLARATLLRHCSPAARDDARRRLVWEAATFAAAGPTAPVVDGPDPVDAADATRRLGAAVAAGELDDAQSLGSWLGRHVHPLRLPALVGDLIVPSLAAAAHGSIFLSLLPRLGRSAAVGSLLGNLTREVARNGHAQLTWMGGPGATTGSSSHGGSLAAAVAETAVLGAPGSSFIQPVMEQAEQDGFARDIIGPHLHGDPSNLGRELLRISTESMLLDDPARAPYGWSHCLTMPQAVVNVLPHLTDPMAGLAVAATHVVGFRAALGRAPLTALRAETEREAGTPGTDRLDLTAGPGVAAATIRRADPAQRSRMMTTVVDLAARHPDAHLAKYTVACLDAAADDPDFAGQHLAASASLAAWWAAVPVDDDPLSR